MSQLYYPRILSTLFVVFIFTSATNAQCYSPQDRDLRLSESNMVVTGKVVRSEPFYNARGAIDTRHWIDVYSTWYGDTSISRIGLVSQGGRINEELTIVRPSLYLQPGDVGVFIARRNAAAAYAPSTLSGESASDWYPVAVHESVIRIDTLTGEAFDQDFTFASLEELEAYLKNYFGRRPHVRRDLAAEIAAAPGRGRSVANITSFSPTVTTAGTGSVVTINGSNFGDSQGTVFFDSPDDGIGGAVISVPDVAIQEWTDTRIRVELSGQVGTGRIQVRAADGTTARSGGNLQIIYGISSLTTSNGLETARLIDEGADGDGGYTYLISNSTANSGQSMADNRQALEALNRAINTWQNDGDYAFYAGTECGTTSIQIPSRDDGVNVISFDNDEYDIDRRNGSGTVGIAFSYYSICGSSEWELIGGDIIFRRNGDPNGIGGSVNWDYDPGSGSSGSTSFESVALHEIGHTHQLTHVSDATQIMNYRVLNGQAITSLSNDDENAAAYVAGLSFAYNPPRINCGGDFAQSRQYLGYQRSADCESSVVFPVELLGFSARSASNGVQLYWETGSELNNDGFMIERSADGRGWRDIGWVSGNGTTTRRTNYDFFDNAPEGGKNYYRLRQRDFDATETLSEVVNVDFKVASPVSFSGSPNPFGEDLTLAVDAGTTERIFRLYDGHGRNVSQIVVPAGRTNIRVTTADLPSGLYWLRNDQGNAIQLVKR